jgi:hypothetical protein
MMSPTSVRGHLARGEPAPRLGPELLRVADDVVDLGHGRERAAATCAPQPVTTMRASGRSGAAGDGLRAWRSASA